MSDVYIVLPTVVEDVKHSSHYRLGIRHQCTPVFFLSHPVLRCFRIRLAFWCCCKSMTNIAQTRSLFAERVFFANPQSSHSFFRLPRLLAFRRFVMYAQAALQAILPKLFHTVPRERFQDIRPACCAVIYWIAEQRCLLHVS